MHGQQVCSNFKVLVAKLSKHFCSVTSSNFELFIKRLRLKLSIDLVNFGLVDIAIVFVLSTLVTFLFTWHNFSIFLKNHLLDLIQ